ncbi:hypothetical protein CDQ92_13230 [Sphingopyxis bauzanensis]|uniref:Uncharacterized protein n=1 Tax=Sphingopyxis bauzanensis TaxID=651663 RepID=A0A246JRX9_9SPHN|nr:hypothetical protein [Sphingopyxis bauzanensis]OWQ95739.1 hypothetical protein CDQ92_13230 [Sphingopyxis bauzanensis]GGJ39632.1 hypothetical protein GCM10011393_07340 [Sphingopyxis bauzanensis]
MADNAIMVRRQGGGDGGGGKVTLESLEQYAARLNRMNFTIAQGIHWFVATRTTPDGEIQHVLDSRKMFDGDESPNGPVRRAASNLRVPYSDR